VLATRSLETAGDVPVNPTFPLRSREVRSTGCSATQGLCWRSASGSGLRWSPSRQTAGRSPGRCWSFFTFTLTATRGALELEVTVPPEHLHVLDGLAARAHAAAHIDS
jgi:hypothetical protein